MMTGTGPAAPASTTRTLSPVRPLPALFAVALLASGCGPGEPRVVAEVATTVIEVAPPTVGRDEARAGFVVAAGGDRALAGLSAPELGCVVEELLIVLEPVEVVALTASGPTPPQAPVVVDALRSCGLVLKVARLGLAGEIGRAHV